MVTTSTMSTVLFIHPSHSSCPAALYIFPPFCVTPRRCRNGRRLTVVPRMTSSSSPISANARFSFIVFNARKDVEGSMVASGGLDKINVDRLLAIAEVLCIVPSVIIAIAYSTKSSLSSSLAVAAFNSPSSSLSCFMGKFYGWQMFLMVGAIVIGALLRKRQWEIITSESLRAGGSDLNLVKRIEKLEEDVRSCGTFIRMLSRQLEKLGIRFRVTRKALKDPISETAALAQKNSEATRALAMQEDILEKELGEIQKVLLAMQEQQQKQLELILAIGKARRLQESQQDFVVKESGGDKSNSAPSEKTVIEQMETPV